MLAPVLAGKPKKSTYRPHITYVSANEYLFPSERYGGHILYLVTIMPSGRAQCECKASDLGKPCKHARLALQAHQYRQNPTHLRGVRPAASAEGLMELYA